MSEVTPIYQKLAMSEIEQLIRDDLIEQIKEYHSEQMNMVLLHPKVYKHLTKKSHKKIKRRLSYEVIWWESNCRKVKYFHSAKRMRCFVNRLHSWYEDVIEIEKVWCYRNHTPKHKWFYESWKPNQFICIERY